MSILTYQDGSLDVKENEIIFTEGQSCQSINILLQGNVDVYLCFLEQYSGMGEVEILKNSFKLFSVDKGTFFGCEGLFNDSLQYFTYKSNSNSNIYVFCTPTVERLQEMLDDRKDYGAFIMTSIATTINHSIEAISNINTLTAELETLTDNLLTFFWHYKEILNFKTNEVSHQDFISRIENYESLKEKNILPPVTLDEKFFTTPHLTSSVSDESTYNYTDSSDALYYKRFVSTPLDARKGFFGCDFNITNYNCRQGILFLNELQEKLKESLKTLYTFYHRLCSKEDSSIVTQYIKASSQLKLDNTSTQNFFKIVDFITGKAQYYINLMSSRFNNDFGMDIEYINNLINQVKLGRNPFMEETQELESIEIIGTELPEELKDSAKKIIAYSEIDEQEGALFLSHLDSFRMIKDKFSSDEHASNLRRTVAKEFFIVYEKVMKKVLEEKPQSRLYHMFLNFGYMDERLLLPEQSISLYSAIEKFIIKGNSQVYCMRDWLTNIYEIEKDPSMNEFSMDYNDVFRDMKKRGEITDKAKQAYLNNKDGRLNFEITNMFRTNHKVCYGQPSTYFPILHKDIFVRDVEKSLVTPEKIMESLNNILEIDYSAFHREINYKNDQTGIEKELIMKQVMPDIILMPTYGSRGIMWQEISGRNRSTPGRLIVPILTAENLDDIMLKLVGNFRWELCRTMMGVAWNDITQKSLTSEYTDYIQFYKKNKDLTDDNKEKIAIQVTKHRNLMREIFTSDYELWFKFESKGIIRLNKVSRSILYKYCPFNKEIRNTLSKHPLFSNIDSQNRIHRAKLIRETENHYQKLQRSGFKLDEELTNNLKFVKEM